MSVPEVNQIDFITQFRRDIQTVGSYNVQPEVFVVRYGLIDTQAYNGLQTINHPSKGIDKPFHLLERFASIREDLMTSLFWIQFA